MSTGSCLFLALMAKTLAEKLDARANAAIEAAEDIETIMAI